jgi:thiamine-monophosphate kinase
MNKLDEFAFIAKAAALRTLTPQNAVIDNGDDCFVFEAGGKRLCVTKDLLIEDVHFSFAFATPYEVGRKSAAANISDIAAMAATPLYAFVGLSMPKGTPESDALAFMSGLIFELEKHGCALCGGDTTRGAKWSVSVTVIGEAHDGATLARNAFRPGDYIAITGSAGDSAAGLEIFLKNINAAAAGLPDETSEYLKRKHLLPEPRVEEAKFLAGLGVTGGMDLSDGIASDLRRVAASSRVGASIEETAMPASRQLRDFCKQLRLPLSDFSVRGGEDYELMVALPSHNYNDIISAFNARFPLVGLTVIGRVTAEPRLKLVKIDGSEEILPGPSFEHF